jgi:predicted negative regulator of RcsB-dependent stress response
MPATGAAARPAAEPIDETFFEWIGDHGRELLIALVVVIAAGAGAMLYRTALATQAGQAETALSGPEQALVAGNIPLAQADLKKVITRYAGTAAAAQAALLLTQTYYDEKRYPEGMAVLSQTKTSGAAKPFASSVESLVSDGYTLQGKYADAATHFVAAADKSPYPVEQARLRANAARAYAQAGNAPAAIAIWTALLADPKSGQAQEAQLRLGELTAKPAGKG